MNSNQIQKQPPKVFYKSVLKKFRKNSHQNTCDRVAGLKHITGLKNIFFTEHLRVAASSNFGNAKYASTDYAKN